MTPAAARSFRSLAVERDHTDPLAHFRDEFVVDDPDEIYLDGNSLGRLPKATADAVLQAMQDEWGKRGVLAWETWIDLGREVGSALAPLVGVGEDEVVLADQTSVNLYKLAEAAAATTRPDIVSDAGNFPSDLYVLGEVARRNRGQLRVLSADPDADLVAGALDDRVGLVSMSHVAFRSGRLADLPLITKVVHEAGARVLWDLSHSAGVVPIDLGRAGVDAAVGCTYKYLNGGPGAPAFLFVRRDLQSTISQPIHGWFGHDDQFGFDTTYRPASDIRRFLVGTPPVLSMVAAASGVAITARAGIGPIRAKSTSLTSWFIELATAHLTSLGFSVDTPEDPEQRGGHVTLGHDEAWRISKALRSQKVIVDYRAPGAIRYGFAPLYTTYTELADAITTTAQVVETGAYEQYPPNRSGVT